MSQTKSQLIEGSAASELTAAKTLLGAGSAGAPSLTATGDTNTGIFFPTADTIAFAKGGVETVRIDSSGLVGIGTSSPGALTHLSNTSSSTGYNFFQITAGSESQVHTIKSTISTGRDLEVNSARTLKFTTGSNTGTFASEGHFQFSHGTNGDLVRITADGKVGIGTATPGVNLEVRGSAGNGQIRLGGSASGTYSQIYSDNDGVLSLNADQSNTAANSYIGLNVDNSERLRITSAGLVGIGVSAPGDKLSVSGGNVGIYNTGTNHGNVYFYKDGSANAWVKYRGDTNAFIFGNVNDAMTIDSSQRVGIGTTSVDELLHVEGSASGGTISAKIQNNVGAASSDAALKLTTNSDTWQLTSKYDGAAFALSNGVGEKLRVDTSGRLLVGTSSSSADATLVLMKHSGDANGPGILHLSNPNPAPGSGAGLGLIRFSNSSQNTFASIEAYADATSGGNNYPGRLVFSCTGAGASSPTERMRIRSNGSMFFGTSSQPSASVAGIKLDVPGNNFWQSYNAGTSSYNQFVFGNGNGPVGSISTSGSATAYNTSSDYRLKENVTAVTDGITRLQQLKPSRFNFIADPDTVVDGFIAHEAQEVVPECITGEKDAVDDDGNPKYQGIDQSKLVPLLTAALQEAVAKIESLEARLTAAGI
jgi:hypothetical protein